MNEQRWLLPLTHGVDIPALRTVVRLAAGCRATLVAVSLIALPDEPRAAGARLEHLQQTQDFFAVVRHLAARFQVRVECYEAWTPLIGARIATGLAHLREDRHADCCVLIAQGQQARLLQNEELALMLHSPSVPLLFFQIPVQQPEDLGSRAAAWLQRTFGRKQEEQAEQILQELSTTGESRKAHA